MLSVNFYILLYVRFSRDFIWSSAILRDSWIQFFYKIEMELYLECLFGETIINGPLSISWFPHPKKLKNSIKSFPTFFFYLQSFFGRTYNNLSSISECKNNGECVINKKNRTSCKACRLRKCLLVGMSKSGSRYGRRSNWFKIHCLLQEQQQNKANNNNSTNNLNNSSINNSTINATSNNSTNSNLLQNDFISSHFLANLYNNYNHNNNNNHIIKSQEFKRQSSPSDSGASSADPDENSIKSNNNNSNKVSNNNHIDSIKPKKIINIDTSEKVRSSPNSNNSSFEPLLGRVASLGNLIKPISPFHPYSIHHSLTPRTPTTPDYFMLQLPQISITPNPPSHNNSNANSFTENEQNEPMDLSLKSNKRYRDHDENDLDESDAKTVRASPSPPSSPIIHVDAPKTVPLDLTCVRSNPVISGWAFLVLKLLIYWVFREQFERCWTFALFLYRILRDLGFKLNDEGKFLFWMTPSSHSKSINGPVYEIFISKSELGVICQ